MFKILFIGDVVGKPGRQCLKQLLPKYQQQYQLDLVLANGENAAGGRGLTQKAWEEMKTDGVDILTSGNHIWDNADVFNFIDGEAHLLRPVNFSTAVPGKGWSLYRYGNTEIAVINLAGKVFMPPVDCPFDAVEKTLAILYKKHNPSIIIVDFHAEATSEKMAMGWFLDGKVAAVLGTHTHIQTADERILPKGTAYITDVGMTAPRDSVIGVDKDKALFKFLTGMPVSLRVTPSSEVQLNAVLLFLDEQQGKSLKIERIFHSYSLV